ncbi:MAG: pyruvate ferredoxin oxidoreductase [Nitrososphaeria archaeon]|nr:pyruvate ferredoxin oxidoreductase [Nitrososphaeria archaeon]NIN53403.1 pyruvate ferredoxin oxidoreductase [Nitrososphaeria archaeon]NIQ33915.1 pyruvate ferredoxin oxidoreductase [Nitrososphaeria archaeon]
MVRLTELSETELLAPGHRLCAGCAAPVILRQIFKAARVPPVVVNATGCVEVSTTIYPFTSWRTPWVHIAFENAAAVASGIEAAYKAMARRGVEVKAKVIAVAGDGGTFDIGIQAMSGAFERGHNFLYVCYDNEAYMNTGIQRSGATPHGAATTTSAAGSVVPGKPEWKKNLVEIAVAHGIPYAATVSPAYWNDLITKAQKALETAGPTFIHAIAPCPRGWRTDPSRSIEMARTAVMTNFFPLYEVENGIHKLTFKPRKQIPVEEYLKGQGRFRHLFKPEFKHVVEDIQKNVDERWRRLLRLCED